MNPKPKNVFTILKEYLDSQIAQCDKAIAKNDLEMAIKPYSQKLAYQNVKRKIKELEE